jgi:alanine racemase
MRAFVEVDLKAIAKNIRWVKRGTSAELLAVVKADAYGHGLVPVAKTALKSGATWLGVALLEEALILRANKIKAPIIAWLTPPGEDFVAAIKKDIQLSVPSIKHLKLIEAAGKKAKKRPLVHIEVDTGMSRGGILDEWDEFLKEIVKAKVEVVGFWSHFARADEPGHEFNNKQEKLFNQKLLELMNVGIIPKYVHLANSAATLTNPGVHNQIVRLGISMYGLSPDIKFMGSGEELGLKPAMKVKALLHLVKDVKKGSPVGYSGIESTSRDTKLGIVSMGYSDGIPRPTSNKAGVFVAGKRAPIIGRVSMDQFVVDLGPDSKAKAGDIATVIGGKGYSIDEWASAAGTINYEIVTRIASRVPRIYV